MNKQQVLGWGGALAAVGIALGAQIGIQRTEAYALAKAHVLTVPEIKELGEPIETSLKLFGFRWSSSGITGEARFAMHARGTSGELVMDVSLTQESGKWAVVGARIRE